MIKKIEIQNFKCFQHVKSFELSKINLLTGVNGRGKSSFLQVLLVLAQSAWKDDNLRQLIINDEYVSLGNFNDIKNSETPRSEPINFNLGMDNPSYEVEIQFAENPEDILQAKQTKFLVNTKTQTSIERQEFTESIRTVHFVSADRLGPQKYVEKTNLPNFIHVGPRGENTINILANSLNIKNVNDLLYRGEDAKSVLQQSIEWLSYILDGARIDIKGQDAESSVLYMLLNNRNNSYSYKPTNMGFGYSYILPLLVTGLIAQPGETIIIENPEAHLHPKAQSRIAEFFARVASCGIQVFIESHSEHILNSLRISALHPDIQISSSDLSIYYFNEKFDAEKLCMNEKGKIANWPIGFFDQQEIDLAEIFKYSR